MNCMLTVLGQLLDEMEKEVAAGGCLIDWHACDLFPKRWIDLVVVLRVDSDTLYDRLRARYGLPSAVHGKAARNMI